MAQDEATIDDLNKALEFDYDTSVIGSTSKDNFYADPNNDEFIWPEDYVRINTVRWADMITGPNSPNPNLFVESFDGRINNLDLIPYKPTKEDYDKAGTPVSILIKSFLESPFNDIEMITRETTRYANKIEAEQKRYNAFIATYDPEEQRLFEEWKSGKSETNESTKTIDPVETNFDTVSESEPRSVWELLSQATTEDLFKFKLDIFEQEVVQNSEDRELRGKIRKAKSICEVCAAYQNLLDAETTE